MPQANCSRTLRSEVLAATLQAECATCKRAVGWGKLAAIIAPRMEVSSSVMHITSLARMPCRVDQSQFGMMILLLL